MATDAEVVVPLPDFGRTTLSYRVRDGNGIWSAWQTLNVRTKQVVNRSTNENVAVEFRVGDPEGVGFSYSVAGLPAGVTFSTGDRSVCGRGLVRRRAAVFERTRFSQRRLRRRRDRIRRGGATSSVGFTWTINHINREPIITNPPLVGLSIQQGQPFELQINGVDPGRRSACIFTISGPGVKRTGSAASITIDP